VVPRSLKESLCPAVIMGDGPVGNFGYVVGA